MKWLADENFDNDILRGIHRRSRHFDVIRAQDLPEIAGAGDTELLAWATEAGRVLLTHDLSTMIPAMHHQLARNNRCTPILLVPDSLALNQVIEEISLLDECSVDDDWTAGVIYLPLS